MEAEYIVIGTFPILWTAWECNPNGFILKDKRGKVIFSYSIDGKDRITQQQMQDKIAEYRNAIKETNKALELLTHHVHAPIVGVE